MQLIAGILIGGHSRRMGQAKALLKFHGRSLLERTVDLANEVAHRVLFLGTPRFELPASLHGIPIRPDMLPDIGPIAGLSALLAAAGHDPALLLACDMPRLSTRLLGCLTDAIHCDLDAVAFATLDGWHPCCAIYMPSAAKPVAARIASSQYALQPLLAAIRTHTIQLSPADAAQLANLNSPEDCGTISP